MHAQFIQEINRSKLKILKIKMSNDNNLVNGAVDTSLE